MSALQRLLRPLPPDWEPPWLALLPPEQHCANGHTWMCDPCPACLHEAARETEAAVVMADHCENGHPLHDLAVDHLLRCRRCVSEGNWAA